MSHANGGLRSLSQADRDAATVLAMPFDRVDRVGGTSNPTDVFKFTLPEDGTYVIRIRGANGSSVVTTTYSIEAVNYSGPPMTSRHEPANNELRTTLTGPAGQTYYVQVGTALFGTPEYQLIGERVGTDSNAFGRSLPTTPWLWSLTGTFDERNTRDVFKIVAQQTGRLQFSQMNLVSGYSVYTAENLQNYMSSGVSSNGGQLSIDVVQGQSYYILLDNYTQTTRSYSLPATFTPASPPPPPDNNETFDTARVVTATGQDVAGQRIGGSDPVDFFRITPSASSDLTFSLQSIFPSSIPVTIKLYDPNRQLISQMAFDSTFSNQPFLRTVATGGQTYYFSVESSSTTEMNYTLRASVVGPDNDNSFETATTMTPLTIPTTPTQVSVSANGLLSAVDRSDYFRFTATLTGSLRFLAAPSVAAFNPITGGNTILTSAGANLDLRIYDSNFALLGEGASPQTAEIVEVSVVAGQTYYANVAMPAGDFIDLVHFGGRSHQRHRQ